MHCFRANVMAVYSTGAQIFLNPKSHLKILGARQKTRGKGPKNIRRHPTKCINMAYSVSSCTIKLVTVSAC
jgi:hypothetical protein